MKRPNSICRSPPLKSPLHFSFWQLQFTMRMSFRSWLQVLRHLAMKRPNGNRAEFILQAEAFAVFVSQESVAIEGEGFSCINAVTVCLLTDSQVSRPQALLGGHCLPLERGFFCAQP